MIKGNKGFGALLTEGLEEDQKNTNPSPSEDILTSRSRTLSQLAAGKIVADKTQFIDPEKCRPWRLHNRDLEKLNQDNCSDLIDSFLSAKRQRIPAIVRRLKDDPEFEYEIIAGVRRWWTVKWLRANHHPEFEYLVTVQRLSDEEAFRLSDLENRARKDITDWERAVEYEKALHEFYDGSQKEMAEHLRISKSWLSRLLDVARLPNQVIEAFGDKHDITVRIARDLKPLASDTKTLKLLEKESSIIAEERDGEGLEYSGPAIAKRLVAATKLKKARAPKKAANEIRTRDGKLLLTVSKSRGGTNIKIHTAAKAEKDEILKAIADVL